MTEIEVARAIAALRGVDVIETANDRFFFYNPDPAAPDHRMPFATLVTSDAHDTASDLNRPGVYRLDLGVGFETYRALFGEPPKFNRDGSSVTTEHDFTAFDQLMPHPIYAAMGWVCVLNPSAETFQGLRPLLEEAHGIAVRRRERS